jgi:hypothetical protein
MKVKLSFFIAYLGSAPVKGASKMLMKLTPGIILTNVLPSAFKCADHKSAKKLHCLLGTFRIWVFKTFS